MLLLYAVLLVFVTVCSCQPSCSLNGSCRGSTLSVEVLLKTESSVRSAECRLQLGECSSSLCCFGVYRHNRTDRLDGMWRGCVRACRHLKEFL